ncbi:MAG: type VI secretion system membrane subunit TssM [Alphaproteobacteria bacterium]|nr:type VI secretion system membrane subunit TssM [Alphaproteobacteria bacterium]
MQFFRWARTSRWVRTFLGVVLLAVIIWLFGPLLGIGDLHPLAGLLARVLAIVAIVVLWLILNLIRELRQSKKDKELVDAVAAAPAEAPEATASAEEVALLSERLKEALHTLKRTRLGRGWFGRRYLYELPWYMFIGPPGAGKTTALANCGLDFPLAATGQREIRGVGGTRNCDWSFTDQAVMIDTAGRYTTQDSQPGVDSAAWLGFLKLLKRYRPRQPLNGILVAINLAELGQGELLTHARAIRKRLRELQDELDVRIPVYVLFTQADRVSGFVEYFDDLGKEDRDQVWGMTFPLDNGKDEGGAVANFLPEFDLLLARLNDRMLERVHQEPDLQRRRLIYGFPQQFASVREQAAEFLTEIFRPSRLETRSLLRGVYFTSGTQDGTTIDRLLGAMASRFGLQRQAVTGFSGSGRSYFLGRLIREVVIGEASLVSLDPKVEARRKWTYRGAYAVSALVLLLLTGFWTSSYFGNTQMIAQVRDETTRYNAQYAELVKRGPHDTDLTAVLPALGTLRSIRGGYEDRKKSTPLALTFGLYQGEKLTRASIDAYYRALNALLLPRLLARLEMQMQAHPGKFDYLYPALKVYLVLGRQGPLQRDLVTQWLNEDLAATYPGEEGAPVRDALRQHVQALLERPLAPVPLNGPLVAQVRSVLTQQPLAEYSYERMMRNEDIKSLPEWTVADNAGPAGAKVFQLRSGKSLQSGVPGVYTWHGYHGPFLHALLGTKQDIDEDEWVFGRAQKRSVAQTIADASKLRRDVTGLYLNDYVRHWDALIADIKLKPFANLNEALDELNTLSAPDSPLRDLMQAIDFQTQLSRIPSSQNAAAKGAGVSQKLAGFGKYQAFSSLSYEQGAIFGILTEAYGAPTIPGAKPPDPAVRVDEHFDVIHKFVKGNEQGSSDLDVAIQKILALYQTLSQVQYSANSGEALQKILTGGGAAGGAGAAGGGAAGGSATQQLQEISKDLPKPIAAMLQTVSASSTKIIASGASQALDDAWRAEVLPLCQAAFDRYPFLPGSSADVPVDDFARLLGPNGLMDTFFGQHLKPYVDTTRLPWRWQAGADAKLDFSPATLGEFQSAAEIRDALFSGGSQIQVRFRLTPVSLDPDIAQISLEIGGQTLTYSHGPTEPMSFQWPGTGGKTLVRVTTTPVSGQPTVVERDGPWALLRLMDTAKVTPSGQPDKFRVTFNGSSGSAAFELNASSVRNPFTLTALRSFRCPPKL